MLLLSSSLAFPRGHLRLHAAGASASAALVAVVGVRVSLLPSVCASQYLRELYGQLEEPDYEAGVIASRLATAEGTAALALLQHGFYNQAKNKIVDAMKTVASPVRYLLLN